MADNTTKPGDKPADKTDAPPSVANTPAVQNRPPESKADEARLAQPTLERRGRKGRATSDDLRPKAGERVMYVWPSGTQRNKPVPADVVSLHNPVENTANLCVLTDPIDNYGDTHLFVPGVRFDPKKLIGTWHFPDPDESAE